MNTNILPFPPQGDSPSLPSLQEMYDVLRRNFAKLDEIDRDAYSLFGHVVRLGDKAQVECVMECRSMAWSMMNRNELTL